MGELGLVPRLDDGEHAAALTDTSSSGVLVIYQWEHQCSDVDESCDEQNDANGEALHEDAEQWCT